MFGIELIPELNRGPLLLRNGAVAAFAQTCRALAVPRRV